MSKRRLYSGLALLLFAAPSVTAQTATQWRDSAITLSARVRALRDSLLQGDSTVREVARSGDLVIGASETLRGAAREALEQFVQVRQRWFGSATPAAGGFRIVLRREARRRYDGGIGEWSTLVLAGLPDTGNSVRTQRNVQRNEIVQGLIDLYGELMWASVGIEVVRWLDLAPPLSMNEKQRRSIAMYALVTGTGAAQRGCVAGNLDDCGYVLALLPPKAANPGGSYLPFVRTDLLLTALDLGGPGAWARFRAASGPRVDAALAAAAGMPLESLLGRWRSQLLALRPTDAPIQGRGALLALGWTAALLLGALGLSRWV